MRRLLLVGGMFTLLLLLWLERPRDEVSGAVTTLELAPFPTVETSFARAWGPRSFRFPEDHGAHPDFQTEWWYYTGNLFDESGNRFGFQLTFFRRGLSPGAWQGPSAWQTNQVYFAHLAITDGEMRRFLAEERWSRGSVGLAGASSPPYQVWLDGWHVTAEGGDGAEQVRLVGTQASGYRLTLRLEARKPLVLQGMQGWSPKGDRPGNASYYYSFTRLEAVGEVQRPDGEKRAVRGSAWMDHEFGSSALSEKQVGWDWFALQLENGWEIMLFRLRRADGSQDYASGTLVSPTGETIPLSEDEVAFEVLTNWESPHTGATYPATWRVQIPSHAIDLRLTPILAEQELLLSVRYWEGAIDIEGQFKGERVEGVGYMELTGYAENMRGRF